MLNNKKASVEVNNMAKSKSSSDIWDEIIDGLILEVEPPVCYIKDAIIVTKNGISYKLSPTDFAVLAAKEKMIPPEQSDIQHCSLSIDFVKIKRDVNKWANNLIHSVEEDVHQMLQKTNKKRRARKATSKKVVPSKKKN